ncbi:hypothetical protein [Nocardia higoensis]|uniref:hypothetical protein n=1 Tax=Nocardia higoensis TaxID=228599 RepID=UPI000A06507B|nr:hypothetical protein [Nocardia higoensis]
MRPASVSSASVSSAAGFVAVTTAALAALVLCAGPAAAAEPVLDVEQGRAGAHLNHDETVWLAGGPIPALVTMVIPPGVIGAGLQPDTKLWRDENGNIHASLRQVISESARHPDGTVSIFLNAPGTRHGRVLDVYQDWSD